MATYPVDREPNVDRPNIRKILDTHRRVKIVETGGTCSLGSTIPYEFLNGTNLVAGDDILTRLLDDGVTYIMYLEPWI